MTTEINLNTIYKKIEGFYNTGMMIDIVCHAQKQKYSKLNEKQVYTKKHIGKRFIMNKLFKDLKETNSNHKIYTSILYYIFYDVYANEHERNFIPIETQILKVKKKNLYCLILPNYVGNISAF